MSIIIAPTLLHVPAIRTLIFYTFIVPRVKEGPLSVPSFYFTVCTVFGRMPGFEPEVLRPQPGVLPIS